MRIARSKYPFGELGAAEVKAAEAEGWRFNDTGLRVGNGFAVWACHEPTGTWSNVTLACPERYPEAWPEEKPSEQTNQLQMQL